MAFNLRIVASSELHTFRGGTGWAGSAWPANPGDADITTWVYDEHTGLLAQKLYDDGHGPAYTYTDAGRLETRTWARTDDQGNPLVTTYTYHPDTGELTHTDYSDSTPDITTTYTRLGQKKTVTDATGTRTFTYSPTTLQPDTESLDDTFFSSANLLTRSHDALGRNDGYQLGTPADPDAVQWGDYNHDQYGRLDQVASSDFPAPTAVAYTYHPESDWLHTTTFPNGLTTTREPEAHRNLVDFVDNSLDGTAISRYDYGNDAAGRRTDVVMTGTAFNQNTFNAYAYNDRSEVVGGQKYAGTDPNDKTNPIPAYDYDYNYDPIGNRQTFTEAGTQTTYTANNLNQYDTITGLTDPQHDLDGNMTTMPSAQGDWTLEWNGENRLIAMETAGPAVDPVRLTFTYDYMGRRVRKQVFEWDDQDDLWSPTADLRYVYDNWNLIATLDAGVRVMGNYTYGFDGAIAKKNVETQDTYYYAHNALSSVVQMISGAGDTVAHYEYSPYGTEHKIDGPQAHVNSIRYGSHILDTETGLYYARNRYWLPETGRFISRDPIQEIGGINLYRYCSNNPVGRMDISGFKDYAIGTGHPSGYKTPAAGDWDTETALGIYPSLVGYISMAGAAVFSSWPDASMNLLHYFGNTGADLGVDVNKLISDVPSAATNWNWELMKAKQFVETLPDGTHSIRSQSVSTDAATKSQSRNWYYAMNAYKAWGEGEAEVHGPCYKLTFEYFIYDRYDWHGKLGVAIGPYPISDSFMRKFHKKGLAREYDIEGSRIRTVTWED